MKKLKLSLQNIEGVEVLSREQLKKVMGGNEEGSAKGCKGIVLECTSDAVCEIDGGVDCKCNIPPGKEKGKCA